MAAVDTTTIAGPSAALVDGFRRTITYLRVSITDRCNLRCRYCMPAEGPTWKPRETILTFEEILRIVGVARELGVRKVRVTGGEPLVRRGCVELIAGLAELGLDEICMTTNGMLFAEQAAALKRAGLTRVNLSLDTLDPEKFRALTRGGDIRRVLESLDAALEHGLRPRLNVVAMRDFNEDELPALAALTVDRPIDVRFIEVMPFDQHDEADRPVSCDQRASDPLTIEEVRAILGLPAELPTQGPGELPVLNTLGPAQYVRLPGARGSVGFIASMHQHICDRCNRVRLTADGWLRPCLLGDERVFVRDAARYGGLSEIRAAFAELMRIKPERGVRDHGRDETMSMIGG